MIIFAISCMHNWLKLVPINARLLSDPGTNQRSAGGLIITSGKPAQNPFLFVLFPHVFSVKHFETRKS